LLKKLLLADVLIFNFDAVFFGEVAQCFNIAHALVLHDEAYSVSALSTAKIFEYAF
jgi:hypothetical protein